jgi:hypothetical protein
MNNRLAMALAVAGGYVLGRSKKGKLALGLGGMVLGKRLNPQVLARAANEQVLHNPQLKEVGDQVREDLRGMGRAATDAVVTRRIDSFADALHQRTLNVQDQLSAAVPDEARPNRRLGSHDEAGEDEAGEDEQQPGEEPLQTQRPQDRSEGAQPDEGGREKRRSAARTRKSAGKAAKVPGRTAPGNAPTARQRTTARKTTAAPDTSGRAKGGEGGG